MGKKSFFFSTVFVAIFTVSIGMAADLKDLETLGEAVFKNKNLSLMQNQSCQTCHHPKAAFADPVNQAAPSEFPVSMGSNEFSFGDRNAPTAAYAGFSPQFHWDGQLFIGGVFWDGRASGIAITDTGQDPIDGTWGLSGTLPTYDPMADQAKGPFQNPVEMALPDIREVVDPVLSDTKLYKIFTKLFPGDIVGGIVDYPAAYNHIAVAIAAFERSAAVNRFSSRFDLFAKKYDGDISTFGVSKIVSVKLLDGTVWEFKVYGGPPAGFTSKYLTQKELIGLALFNSDSTTQLDVTVPQATTNGGMCYLCHLTTKYNTDAYGTNSGTNLSKVAAGTYPPVFTDFSYDNLGIPVNERARLLSGVSGPDIGLGAQVAIMTSALDSYTNKGRPNDGKFKVPSLRGVAKSAPYGHNGFFPTLTDIVNFYNAREAFYTSYGLAPEVPANVNTNELGNLGMTTSAVENIVAFMKTLTDQ